MLLTFAAIQQAWEVKDPALVDYIVNLAEQGRPEPDTPIRDEALTFDRFLAHIFSPEFRNQSPAAQQSYRLEQLALLESEDAEVPLPESLKLNRILLLLWTDEGYYARTVLINVIRRVPLVYGPWKALKHIYKAAEERYDYELLGEIAARFDSAGSQHNISPPTLTYITRRAWRYLRKLGESLPACYAEVAVYYLAAYPENTDWNNTWVANHIFHHQTRAYNKDHFCNIRSPGNWLKNRAFAEAWQRSPAPLLRLLGMAQAERVRDYACKALKTDFPFILRNIETETVISLMALPTNSPAVDGFIVWLLKQASRFEQHLFRPLGLHEGILQLLESEATEARAYACDYVRAHVRDMPLDKLLLLANSEHQTVRKLAQQLISERDPRKDIGLEAWGQLLESRHANAFASQVLRKHFGRKELTAAWFRQRLLAATHNSLQFVKDHLLELHPLKTLGTGFFQDVLKNLDNGLHHADKVAEYAQEQLQTIGLDKLPADFVQTFLLHPLTQYTITRWIDDDDIKAAILPIAYCKALTYEPDWQQHPLIQQLRQSNQSWAHNLRFDEDRAETMRGWLADVRRFNPADLGFEWLMQLVNREESSYHQFAADRMIKAFLPADFAPADDTLAESAAPPSTDDAPAIDLNGQTFLFTGKLQTMTRKEAQTKVTSANGKNSSAVNGKLNYLVIGDEGSPLYGNGRKGSKQLKAESLMEGGADLKIISETAFLQMLAGEQREFSAGSVMAGCETLWNMAVAEPDTPVGKFARKYLRYHHPSICLEATDRPVDPGAEIPADFLTFALFEPLFQHGYAPLRRFALEFARWEFARWSPVTAELIDLCESRHTDVREFAAQALLAEPDEDNRHYRIDAGKLEASAVYSFCEAKDTHTRQLGMQIIQRYTKFQLPESLFLLSESPDRELRAFVVRVLWSLYRRYSTTPHWQPRLPVMASMGKKQQEQRVEAERNLGAGLPQRPDNLPADPQAMQQLLKRWLYELPPGPLGNERLSSTLKPLSASAAKKALIETFRDLAVEDAEFAHLVLPLFRNFTRSRGAMEQAACLVGVTRIQHAHPQLPGEAA